MHSKSSGYICDYAEAETAHGLVALIPRFSLRRALAGRHDPKLAVWWDLEKGEITSAAIALTEGMV